MTELRHGYTLSDLHQMTVAALMADRSMAMDYRDRRDVAWSAIAEALYAADAPPHRQELIRAGWQAIYREVRAGYRHAGHKDREWDAGFATAPRMVMYWLERQVVPSPETGVVERLSLPPILAALTAGQRTVVAALAAHDGDRDAAAAALSVTVQAFNAQLQKARRLALALWLEGETPHQPALRRPDRRRHREAVAACGTSAAARRHRSRREPLDEACMAAEREYDRARKGRALEVSSA